MERFDCLDPHTVIWGKRLLEASAGTGKTFAIEQLFVRLLIESDRPCELSEIVAVTFTRSAARELKGRIRAAIERKMGEIGSGDKGALEGGERDAHRRLARALALFESGAISTIHGLCYRLLKDYAVEAEAPFILTDPNRPSSADADARERELCAFLKQLPPHLLSPSQVELALSGRKGMAGVIETLLSGGVEPHTLNNRGVEREAEADFGTTVAMIRQKMAGWSGPAWSAEELKRDVEAVRGAYKKLEGDVDGQIEAFASLFAAPDREEAIDLLIRERGVLFANLSDTHRRQKGKEPPPIESRQAWDFGFQELYPILEAAGDPKQIRLLLKRAWKKRERAWMEESGVFSPDALLEKMVQAVERPAFCERVRARFSAVIIDEFQDTDPLQWKIIEKLFLRAPALRALYLVGDPKQSIYRFRRADIYTYLSAAAEFTEGEKFALDTNYRSSAPLLTGLNRLFDREWLSLPKWGKTLPYRPVKAGRREEPLRLTGGKKAIHIPLFPEGATTDHLLSYFAAEMVEMQKTFGSWSSCALLVADRKQAASAAAFLRKAGIPFQMNSREPLGTTSAFRAVEELLRACEAPEDAKRVKAVYAGPFGSIAHYSPDGRFLLAALKKTWQTEGLRPFFSQLLKTRFGPATVEERMGAEKMREEVFHLFDLLFAWELDHGIANDETMRRKLAEIASRTVDEDSSVRRRADPAQDGVHILTIHVSKGLEFPVVFAWGLLQKISARREDADIAENEQDELDAEKMRLLYVAATRPRERLYLPLIKGSEKSALARFFSHFPDGIPREEEISEEEVPSPPPLPPLPPQPVAPPSPLPRFYDPPCYTYSFTSLASERKWNPQLLPPPASSAQIAPPLLSPTERPSETVRGAYGLPRGSGVGIALHALFQSLLTSPGWRDPQEWKRRAEKTPWPEEAERLVQAAFTHPLPSPHGSFRLIDVDPDQVAAEFPFLTSEEPHFLKGFIDLVLIHQGYYYVIDWKSNWLGPTPDDYSPERIQQVIDAERYDLQAAIYQSALARHFSHVDLQSGGAFYLFLRSLPDGRGIHYIPPPSSR